MSPSPSFPPLPAKTPQQGSNDERQILLDSVLGSRTFAKSKRLAQFLKFICTLTINGKAEEINEQQIGVCVFERSPTYVASDDSIVRTQARLLRQRLEEYFEHEASSSSLIITIPKGGYVPVFESRQVDAGLVQQYPLTRTAKVATPPGDGSQGAVESRFHRGWIWAAVGGAALLLVAAAAITLWHGVRLNTSASDVLWAQIFKEGRPVVMVPSDDGLVLFEEQAKTQVQLNEYLSGSYLDRVNPADAGQFRLSSAWFAAHQYTSTADLNLALRLGRLPAARDSTIETRNARILRIDDLKSHNVILIGGLGANPWIELFLGRLNFEVNYDWKTAEGYVVNKHPGKGEPSIYRDRVTDGSQRSYGVFAFLPGLEDQGDVLLFEGTGMAGTESAADFPFDSKAFTAFARQIGAGPRRLPYFEVLLETSSVGGNAPEVHVVTYRVIQG